jgi:hypothetical protein
MRSWDWRHILFHTETKDGNIEPKPVRRDLDRDFYEKGEELRRAIAQWIWSRGRDGEGHLRAASCK